MKEDNHIMTVGGENTIHPEIKHRSDEQGNEPTHTILTKAELE